MEDVCPDTSDLRGDIPLRAWSMNWVNVGMPDVRCLSLVACDPVRSGSGRCERSIGDTLGVELAERLAC
jgi:hypothetical protein